MKQIAFFLMFFLFSCTPDPIIWENHIDERNGYRWDGSHHYLNTPIVFEPLVLIGEEYSSDNGYLKAFDKDTGKLKWVFKNGDNDFTINDNKLYLTSDKFYRLDTATGQVEWEYAIKNDISEILYSRKTHLLCDNLAILISDKLIVALDAKNGTLQWRRTGSFICPSAVCTPESSLLLISMKSGVLDFIQLATGKTEKRFARSATSLKTYKHFDNSMISSADEKNFYIFSTVSSFAFPIIVNNTVLFIEHDFLYCLDLLTETLLWRSKTAEQFPHFQSPIIMNKSIIINGWKQIAAHHLDTGEIKWKLKQNTEDRKAILVKSGALYRHREKNIIEVFDAETGRQSGYMTTQKPLARHTFFQIHDNTIFYISEDKILAEKIIL